MLNVVIFRLQHDDFVKFIDFIEARNNLESGYENVKIFLKAGPPVDNLKNW